MTDFTAAYKKTLGAEGWFKLTNIPGDAGGQTYAGISRRANPSWEGWKNIDRGQSVPESMVSTFYKATYWDAVFGDDIADQHSAESLYDFAVNGGGSTARVLAQKSAGVNDDGIFGPVTIAAINSMDPKLFTARFALYKIDKYRKIVQRSPEQVKFLLGWINRTIDQEELV